MKIFRYKPAPLVIAAIAFIIALVALSAINSPLSAQTGFEVIAPARRTDVKSCAEYSDEVLRDKWDMNERTDLGWRIFNTIELPPSFLTNISFANGIFSAKTVATPGYTADYSDMNISILDSHYAGTVPLGKVGTAYPINADKYTVLILRMYLGPKITAKSGTVYWSKNTIYGGVSWSNPFDVYDGWYFYYLDIPALGKLGGTDTWSGLVDSLRLDPIGIKDKDVKIDWIRLVQKETALEQTIGWKGYTGLVDIYLDNNTTSSDGTLGLLAKSVSGERYTFLTGGLAAGDYYAVVVPTGTNPAAQGSVQAYSIGYFHVNDVPIVTFTKPSEEGSTEDYAAMTFGDPWDMANDKDVEYTVNLDGPQFTTLNYQDINGNNFANQTVYKSSSLPGVAPLVGDPQAFLLHWLRPDGYPARGKSRPINADRYHNFVGKLGIAGPFSYYDGSHIRVIWKNQNETLENVSDDIIVRHLNDNSADYGPWIMNKIVVDLKRPDILEQGAASPSHSGWTGWLDAFRVDPHEFSTPREFFYDDIKLTADWTADKEFTVNWTVSHFDPSPTVATTVSLYYDKDNSGYDGTLIAGLLATDVKAEAQTGAPATETMASYKWNVSGLAAGKYWLYAVVTDGTNTNRAYAGGPLIVDHNQKPQIALNREQIFFGAVSGKTVSSKEKVLLSNAGPGTLNWTVSIRPDTPFIKVSPMSGTGNAVLEVSLDPASLPASGAFWGTVTVNDANAWNSPQLIDIWGQVYPSGMDFPPFGTFETPASGSTVSGSIPVTGWVLDDVETTRVMIYRSADPTDPAGAIGPNGLVYVGDGTFVKGARPDVEANYFSTPRSDRAGWGYMMLTNFLPNKGNGTFTLYAYAYDGSGNETLLGTSVIVCDNNSRTLPFGTIDTPDQGGAISGSSFVNFGWALTPLPKTIPFDGSTIAVYIDSVEVGRLNTPPNVYDQYRPDVAGAFPGLNNSKGPVGAYFLNSTLYTNAVHTLAWIATDNAGAADGIGSRYFEVQNMGTGTAAQITGPPEGLFAPVDSSGKLKIGLVKDADNGIASPLSTFSDPLTLPYAKGDSADATPSKKPALKQAVLKRTDENGLVELEVEQMGMLELRFEGRGGNFIGWGAKEAKELPIGSTLDRDKGLFSWMPGPGFLGRHMLHFAVTDGKMKSRPIAVVVNIVPRKYTNKR